MNIITNREVYQETYSNAKGDSKDGFVKKEDRLMSESNRTKRKEARDKAKADKELLRGKMKAGDLSKSDFRKQKRAIRKEKRNATKLQLLKRFSKDKKPLFAYRLKKVFKKENGKAEKEMPDGTKVEVKPENQVVTPQGIYDLTEISKALGITAETFKVNQADILKKLIALESDSKNLKTAVETIKTNPLADLSVPVTEDKTETMDDGYTYLTDETQLKTETVITDVADEDKKKQGMSTTTKIVLITGSVIVVGIVAYIIWNSRQAKTI